MRGKYEKNLYKIIALFFIWIGLISFTSIIQINSVDSRKPDSSSVPLILQIALITEDGKEQIVYDGISKTVNKGRVPFGSKVTISVKTQDHCQSMRLYLTGGGLADIEFIFGQVSSLYWEYNLDTSNVYDTILSKGEYTFEFVLSDGTLSNSKGDEGYSFPNIMEIYDPQTKFLIYLIVGVIGVVIIFTLIIRRVKKKKAEKVVFSKATTRKRKREIYSGASSIGRLDGKVAESKMAMRRSSIPTKPRISTKRIEKTRTKVDTSFSKLPETVQLKMEESKVDVITRAEFIDAKIDNLRSQLDILNTIIGLLPERSKCPLCGKAIGKDWEICPFCTVEENKDEINLKKASMQIKKRIRSKCPKCGLILDPNWITCPKCFVEERLNK
ncbi:MAG: zinc ribbon domain-containing protein [Promethearchaeota archaeon]